MVVENRVSNTPEYANKSLDQFTPSDLATELHFSGAASWTGIKMRRFNVSGFRQLKTKRYKFKEEVSLRKSSI